MKMCIEFSDFVTFHTQNILSKNTKFVISQSLWICYILNIYSDIFIRKNITKSAGDHILISLQVKHKDMIKDADIAEKVLVLQFYKKIVQIQNMFMRIIQLKIPKQKK